MVEERRRKYREQGKEALTAFKCSGSVAAGSEEQAPVSPTPLNSLSLSHSSPSSHPLTPHFPHPLYLWESGRLKTWSRLVITRDGPPRSQADSSIGTPRDTYSLLENKAHADVSPFTQHTHKVFVQGLDSCQLAGAWRHQRHDAAGQLFLYSGLAVVQRLRPTGRSQLQESFASRWYLSSG